MTPKKQQTAAEWLVEELKKHNLLVKPYTKGVNSLYEKAMQMEKERDKKIALYFMVLGIKNKGDFSKIDFYKEIDKL